MLQHVNRSNIFKTQRPQCFLRTSPSNKMRVIGFSINSQMRLLPQTVTSPSIRKNSYNPYHLNFLTFCLPKFAKSTLLMSLVLQLNAKLLKSTKTLFIPREKYLLNYVSPTKTSISRVVDKSRKLAKYAGISARFRRLPSLLQEPYRDDVYQV